MINVRWMTLVLTCGSLISVSGVYEDKLFAALFDAGYIGLNRYWDTAIVKQRRVAGAIPVDWSHFDSDRACVECFSGRLKRVFWILRDDAFPLHGTSWSR